MSVESPEGLGGTELRQPPRRFSRGRLAFFKALERLSTALGGRHFYRAVFLRRGRFRIRREVIVVPQLAPEFEGFTIVQLSDPHAGPFLGEGDLAHVVDACNELKPDVIVLTGDLITGSADEAYGLIQDFKRLRASRGIFGVFGNHDYCGRREREIAARFAEQAGMRFLMDECVRLGDGPGSVTLVGLEDLEEARSLDLAGARAEVQPGDVEVVLCHNPSGVHALADAGCRVVLSGHTHGHQINLPLIRRLAPAHPGDRVEVGGTTLITHRGLGVLGLPLRICSPAEVVIVELRRREPRNAR